MQEETHTVAFSSIAFRGKAGAKEYPLYVKGIRDLWGHIYAESYSTVIAAVRVVRVMVARM